MPTHRASILAASALLAAIVAVPATAAPTLGTPGRSRPLPRAIATEPPTAPPPVVLSTSGVRPDVLVDEAGTAHIVWNEPGGGGPDVTVYCRVPRTATACDITQRLIPPGADSLSADAEGPQVAAVNDQIVVLSHRYPQEVAKPNGDASIADDTLWLWSSDDGGRTFSAPGIVGIGTIDGDARAFGTNPDNPFIGALSGVRTGGVVFSASSGGQFQAGGARLAEGDAFDGRMTVSGGVPSVVYHDLGSTSYLRTWTGRGDPNDAATWTPPQPFPGLEPEITEAGGRLWVTAKKPGGSTALELRDLASGATRTVNTGVMGNDSVPIGHADGTVSVVWQGQEDGVSGVWRRERVNATGPIPGTPTLVSTEEGAFLAAAEADDGGGVAVRDTNDRRILLSSFGTTLPTGRLGLGNAPGGGAPPADVAVSCQKIQLGAAVQALGGSCYLSASRGGVKVSTQPFRLNGLEIVPDAGVQVQIDVRAKTIRSTGTVSVLMRAPGVPDITLFRGRLDIDASGRGAGAVLATFGERIFRPNLLGFPLRGDIDIRLAPPDGVRIPVSLELPRALGDVRGAATLLLDNRRGLVLESLDFTADGIPLGPATLRRMQVQYRTTGGTTLGTCLVPPGSGATALPDEWAGVFELELPPPKTGPGVCGSIRFGTPEGLREATFRVDLPYPGVVLFPGMSLTSLGGGLRLTPAPAQLDGRFRIEFAGAAKDVSAAQMDGSVTVVMKDPLLIRGTGTFRAAGLQIGTGVATVSTDGYADVRLTSGPTIGMFRVSAGIQGFVDAPRGVFSLHGSGSICVRLAGGVEPCLDGSEATVSTQGVAVCLPEVRPPVAIPVPPFTIIPPRGAGYRWGESLPEVWLLSCYASRYVEPGQRAQAADADPVPERSFDLAAGSAATIRVAAATAVPDVDLVGPDGAVVAPDADLPDTTSNTRFLAIRTPAAGRWTVRARATSPLITDLAVSRDRTAPAVAAVRVTGRGTQRRLGYRATFAADQGVTFVERGAAGSRVLGAAAPGTHVLAFSPGPGPGGRRQVVAQLLQDGLVRDEAVVAAYVAPPPPVPGRARALRVVRGAGGVVSIRWTPGAHAARQRLVVAVPGGPLVTRILGGRARAAVVRDVDGRAVTVTVAAVGADGRRGAAVRRAFPAGRRS